MHTRARLKPTALAAAMLTALAVAAAFFLAGPTRANAEGEAAAVGSHTISLRGSHQFGDFDYGHADAHAWFIVDDAYIRNVHLPDTVNVESGHVALFVAAPEVVTEYNNGQSRQRYKFSYWGYSTGPGTEIEVDGNSIRVHTTAGGSSSLQAFYEAAGPA
jgi:hypothetical protein